MNKFDITYQELPVNIVAFYTKIKDSKHIVVNSSHDTYTQKLGFFGCMYYQCKNEENAKITIDDINKENFEPMLYAKEKVDCFFKKD